MPLSGSFLCHSLLSTLDTLALATMTALFLLVAVVLSAASGLSVTLRLGELLQHARLTVHVSVGPLLGSGKRQLKVGKLIDGDAIGEGNLEHDEEVAELVGLLVEGQSFLGNGLQVVGLDDLTWLVLDAKLSAIEVSDHEVNTG